MKIIGVLLLLLPISIDCAAPDTPSDNFNKVFQHSKMLAFQIRCGEQQIRKLAEDPINNADEIIVQTRIVDKIKSCWLRDLDNVAQLFLTVPAERFAHPFAQLKREWDRTSLLYQQKNYRFAVLQNSVSSATKLFLEKRQHMQCASADQMRSAWSERLAAEAMRKKVEQKIAAQLHRCLLIH